MKKTRMYMVRRGRRYLIERKADGTFGKWIPLATAKSSKAKTVKKAAGTKTYKPAVRTHK
jgi:hypothetical protein